MFFMILIITFLLSGIFILSLFVAGFFWKPLKLFFHQDNYTYFDVCFLGLYFIEQVFFIITSYFYIEYDVLLTGLFALMSYNYCFCPKNNDGKQE